MKTLGWLSFGLLVFVQSLAVSLLLVRSKVGLTLLACLVLAVHPMLICWGASGMETCLYAALVMGAFLVLVAGDFAKWPLIAGLLLALAGMTRPEAIALAPVAAWVAYLRCRRPKEPLQVLTGFVSLYGIYFGIRWWHFGYMLPNTFYAKLDYSGQAVWQRGIRYVWDFLLAKPLVALLAGFTMVRAWRAPTWIKAWSLVVLAQFLIVVYEGGDHLAMFRFLLVIVPFLGMLALAGPFEWVQSRSWSGPAKAAALGVCLALVFVTGLRVGRTEKRDEAPGVQHFARFIWESRMARDWAQMGQWFRGQASEGSSLSTIAIGAIGFFSDLTIVDPHGLIDPEIAHRDAAVGTGYAGHEKFDIGSTFVRRPTYLLLANQLTSVPIPEDSLSLWSWGDFNRSMVGDSRLAQLYRYEPVEIGPDQWMNLHVLREK